ncbi:MAG: hypothetical protein ACRDA5_04860 [Clostridium sp.]
MNKQEEKELREEIKEEIIKYTIKSEGIIQVEFEEYILELEIDTNNITTDKVIDKIIEDMDEE